MPKTKEKEAKPCPPFKKGDFIARAGNVWCEIIGAGAYSGSLHTKQWMFDAIFHDKSRASIILSDSDKKIDPKKELVVMAGIKTRSTLAVSLKEWVLAEVEYLGNEEEIDDGELEGIAHVLLADNLSLDSMSLENDLRIRKEPNEAAVVTVAELFA